jgi:hypothetical protein
LGRDRGIRRLHHLRRNTAAFAAKDQDRQKDRDDLFGMNAGRGLFGNYGPSSSGFRIGDNFINSLKIAPML